MIVKICLQHDSVARVNWRQLILVTFYRAMLCIRGTSHGPVSVSVSVSVTSRSSTKTTERIWLVIGKGASFDLSYIVL